MTSDLLLTNALVLFAYMSAWYLVGFSRKRLDTVDIAWGGGFFLVALSSFFYKYSLVTFLVLALVTVWAARLAAHIAKRGLKTKEDPRYQQISSKWQHNFWLRAYFSIFLFQGLLIWIISLPVVAAAGDQLDGKGYLVVLGALVWLAGFIIESIADKQLAGFLSSKNQGKVMDKGLWRYSRHPNYFGEITQWFGIAVIALSAENGWAGLIGPVFLTLLIVFVSGIPPIENRRKKDPEYRQYMAKTSPLVPLPPKA